MKFVFKKWKQARAEPVVKSNIFVYTIFPPTIEMNEWKKERKKKKVYKK